MELHLQLDTGISGVVHAVAADELVLSIRACMADLGRVCVQQKNLPAVAVKFENNLISGSVDIGALFELVGYSH